MMTRMAWTVLACLLFAVSVSAAQVATFTLTTPTGPLPNYVGTNSQYYFVDITNKIPEGSVQLNLAEVDSGNGADHLTFTPSTLSFGPGTRSASFRVSSRTAGSFTFSFTKVGDSDTDPTFAPAIGNQGITFVKRPITVEKLSGGGTQYIGEPSEPKKVYITIPSTEALTITISTSGFSEYVGNNTVTIKENPITIPAGALSASYSFETPSSVIVGSIIVTLTISGGEGLYIDSYNDTWNFGTVLRPVTVPTFSANVILGGKNNYLYAYTQQEANTSFTVTPQAADTTFTPSSVTFNVGQQVARFQFETTSPYTSKQVYWYLSGDGAKYYNNIPTTSINIPKRAVFAKLASTSSSSSPVYTMVLTNRTWMQVSLPYPTPNSVTVDFYAANVQFSPATVTFDKNVTSFAVAIDPTNTGADTVSFKISGTDMDLYGMMPDISFNVGNGIIFGGSTSWYIPTLYIGKESPKIPIRASLSPMATVTVTPSAPDLQFTPASLTFRNGTEQQWFTITPLYTNQVNTNSTTDTIIVTWLVSGTDHAYFNAPNSFSVVVNRRYFQNTWSAHLTNTDTSRNPPADRHLGKTYKVWSTVNYIGDDDEVTLTPVSPYFSFNPKVLNFNKDKTRILYEATVTGVVGNTNISYIIGGPAGGFYTPLSPETWNTAVRPLKIEAGVLAYDSRMPHKKATLVQHQDWSNYYLGIYHVLSFTLRSFVLPDNGLTITPHCPHITFSPSSIHLKPKDAVDFVDVMNLRTFNLLYPYTPNYTFVNWNYTGLYMEANFNVIGQASGTHLVTFELSGPDAPFYDIPDDTPMTIKNVARDSNEPVQSASVIVVPSIAMFVVALFAIFM